MLDQNTDRMWYVIGAVIIGAAIIFILNGTMPELFASVGGTFEGKTKETTEIVDGIGPRQQNLIVADDVTDNRWIDTDGLNYSYYASFVSGSIAVNPGSTVVIVPSNYQAGLNPDGKPYPTAIVAEYDANGVFITRQSNMENKPLTITLSSNTYSIKYAGKSEGGQYVNGQYGHRLYVAHK